MTKKEKVLAEVLDQVENTPQGTKALTYFARVVVTKKMSLKDRKCLWGTNALAYFVKVAVTMLKMLEGDKCSSLLCQCGVNKEKIF